MAENPIVKLVRDLSVFGLEIIGRYYSFYRGKVKDNNDPKQCGRIAVIVPAIGTSEKPLSFWAKPISPFGFLSIPAIGDVVWVVFEKGNLQEPCYIGSWWKVPTSDIPDELLEDYPNSFGIVRSGVGIVLNLSTKLINLFNGGGYVKIDQENDAITFESQAINLGEGANYNVPFAQELYNTINSTNASVQKHVHPNGNNGNPTGSPTPAIPAIMSWSSWASSRTKTV